MNDLVARFNEFTLGQKIIAFMIVAVVMVALFYSLHYEPYQSETASLETQLRTLQEENEKLVLLRENHQEVLANLADLERRLVVAREQLPISSEIPSLLQRIHNQAQTAGLAIESFTHLPDVSRDFYTEIPVAMQLNGTYDELANFFYYLGRMTRIVNVRDMDLKRAATGIDGDGRLTVSAMATTYKYEGSAPVPAK